MVGYFEVCCVVSQRLSLGARILLLLLFNYTLLVYEELLEDSQKPVWDSKPLASPKFLDDLPVGFYDLAGRWVANETERMRRGMYILIEQKDGIIVQSKVFIQ